MCQSLIDFYKNKKVLIMGFGREGISTYNYIRKYLPEKQLGIADMKEINLDDLNVTLHTGENYMEAMKDYDIVMKTPGISVRDVEIPEGVTITCQTDLFLKYAPCMKIGITGTKGKTTTSTLIYEVIAASGKDTCLIGNIGVPVFDVIDASEGKIAVIEMSSHQLEFTRTSPHIAVLTNVYPEHLDHYNGFEGYVGAKLNIMNHQSEDDYLVYNPDQDLTGVVDFSVTMGQKIAVSAVQSDEFLQSLTTLNGRLLGVHTHQDIFFAAKVAEILGISKDAVKKGVENFKGIPHRLEPVGEFKGVKFFNDSIATIPHAVECGVEAIGDVDTLIFGGLDRGIDYDEFEKYLISCPVSNLIGMPETGHSIIDRLTEAGCKKTMVKATDMEHAVGSAFELTAKGKSCLLSPAASSYNVYKNFEYKGNHYKEVIKKLGE
ncbi:MAG: UDP-N-acetylmuramoyl-L-alanine--D-glutamate ligase [Clostridia bacterium]|nr:UDP-N-acetylmuramoyl-L-alanine--D-glutamate ligase [Clostridia bacterium]